MKCGKLKNIYLHITESCDHHCNFCYAAYGLGNFGHAEIDKIKKIITYASKAGVEKISLVGGDPVLHPNIAEILGYIATTTEMKTVLMTNTAHFPNNTIEELASLVNVVMITVHGDNSIQHDAVTSVVGSYENLINSCLEFQRYSVPIEVAYNITPHTYDQIISSLETLINRGLKINRYVLQRIAPIMDKNGNILKLNREFVPNKEQINIALSQIVIAEEEYKIPIELVDPFPLCIVNEEFRSLITPCKCGLTDLSINGKGDVSRCGADPNYQLGNIFTFQSENPLLELWENSPILTCFRERKYLPKRCRACEDKWICGGGCEMNNSIFVTYDRDHLEVFNSKE